LSRQCARYIDLLIIFGSGKSALPNLLMLSLSKHEERSKDCSNDAQYPL
jgi:hypothetical protein